MLEREETDPLIEKPKEYVAVETPRGWITRSTVSITICLLSVVMSTSIVLALFTTLPDQVPKSAPQTQFSGERAREYLKRLTVTSHGGPFIREAGSRNDKSTFQFITEK